jgi:hypothetical protein
MILASNVEKALPDTKAPISLAGREYERRRSRLRKPLLA